MAGFDKLPEGFVEVVEDLGTMIAAREKDGLVETLMQCPSGRWVPLAALAFPINAKTFNAVAKALGYIPRTEVEETLEEQTTVLVQKHGRYSLDYEYGGADILEALRACLLGGDADAA